VNSKHNTMACSSIIKDKSFVFAIEVIKLYKFLISEKKEYVISKQLLRSGTSIGANIREGLNAESRADFIHKMAISQKEADETCYWLDLLKASDYINEPRYSKISQQSQELLKMLRSIILTTKQNTKK